MADKLYTVTELADLFGVTRQNVHYWIKQGRFPNNIRLSSGMIVIPASDVEAVKREEAEKLIEQLNRLGFQTVPA